MAFRRLGHNVVAFNTSNLWVFKIPLIKRIASKFWMSLLSYILYRKLKKTVAGFQPDFMFCEKSTWLRKAQFESIRQAGPSKMKIIHYNADDPFGAYGKEWNNFIKTISFYDIHFVPKHANISDYLSCGATQVYAFDRSYDSSLHHPITLSDSEKKKYECVVGFIGTFAPYREQVIADLICADIPVAVWGNGWHHGKNWTRIRPFWRGAGQYDEAYVKAICGMKIALHFLRHENRDEQDSRTFEIPACGVFMLAERSKAHERLFQEGKEAVFFDDAEELREKIHYYLENDAERKAIAEAGRQRGLASGYDHDSRLKEIFEKVGIDL